MSWSLTLFRVGGSEIRIHITFLLILLWIGVSEFLAGGAASAGAGVAFVLAVFACVTSHELGHAFAARRYGISTPDITLLPIGGLAQLSRMPEKPSEEIVIALAGPAVNVAIALLLIALIGGGIDLASLESAGGDLLTRLIAVNVTLVLFNLIPAFPMDGGRVLRAALATRLGRGRATQIAALIGQGVAFFFGFAGLFSGNAILVFIAIFVYLAASAEAGEVGLMETARRLPVERAMIASFERLGVEGTIEDGAEALLRTTQAEFPIVDDAGRLRGFLTRQTLIKALRQLGPQASVLEAMAEAPTVNAGQRLSAAIALMQEQGLGLIGVTDPKGRLLGYVSQENLAELMMLQSVQWPSPAP